MTVKLFAFTPSRDPSLVPVEENLEPATRYFTPAAVLATCGSYELQKKIEGGDL